VIAEITRLQAHEASINRNPSLDVTYLLTPFGKEVMSIVVHIVVEFIYS